MEILFFLIPKSQVAHAFSTNSIRQVIEKLDYHHYTMIPVIDKEGKYVYSISDGDLFWYFRNHSEVEREDAEKISISEVPKRREIKAVKYDASMEDLFTLAINQNFVPVIDDKGVFIGIITRRSIIEYLSKK